MADKRKEAQVTATYYSQDPYTEEGRQRGMVLMARGIDGKGDGFSLRRVQLVGGVQLVALEDEPAAEVPKKLLHR